MVHCDLLPFFKCETSCDWINLYWLDCWLFIELLPIWLGLSSDVLLGQFAFVFILVNLHCRPWKYLDEVSWVFTGQLCIIIKTMKLKLQNDISHVFIGVCWGVYTETYQRQSCDVSGKKRKELVVGLGIYGRNGFDFNTTLQWGNC